MKIAVVLFCLAGLLSLVACNDADQSAPANTANIHEDTAKPSADKSASQPVSTNSDRGRVLFQEKCMACHGMNGDAQSNNAANLPHSVLDSLAITQVIKNGRGTMPMFKDAIADSDIAHLAVYVHSLRK